MTSEGPILKTMEKDDRKKEHKKNIGKTKMGTWNVRSILKKEEELVEEMMNTKSTYWEQQKRKRKERE